MGFREEGFEPRSQCFSLNRPRDPGLALSRVSQNQGRGEREKKQTTDLKKRLDRATCCFGTVIAGMDTPIYGETLRDT